MNSFSVKAKRAQLEANMYKLQARLYDYLISIDVNTKPAERLASYPSIRDYDNDEFNINERSFITPIVDKYKKLSETLYATQ